MKHVNEAKAGENRSLLAASLQLGGDILVMLAHCQDDLANHRAQFEEAEPTDDIILESIMKDPGEFCMFSVMFNYQKMHILKCFNIIHKIINYKKNNYLLWKKIKQTVG